MKRDLVINYGLRWEINMAPTESGGRVYVPNGPIVNNSGLVAFQHAERHIALRLSERSAVSPYTTRPRAA